MPQREASDDDLETSDLFKDVVFYVDPSLPKILVEQITTLLIKNQARGSNNYTPNLKEILNSIEENLDSNLSKSKNFNPTQDSRSRYEKSRRFIKDLRPEFDLTTTTHLITSSIHLPEYRALGKSDTESGDVLEFSFHSNSHPYDSSSDIETVGTSKSSKTKKHRFVKRSIHLVTPLWVTQSYDLNKVLPENFYSPDPYKFFSGIVIALDSEASLPITDIEIFEACVRAWGGQFKKGLTREVTHLICVVEGTKDYRIAMKVKDQVGIKVVLPHWFHHSVLFRKLISEEPFQFPSPSILRPLSPSLDPEIQHGSMGIPGSKLPGSSRRIISEVEVEENAYKTATQLAFDGQNIPSRTVSQGLIDYLELVSVSCLSSEQSVRSLFEKSSQSLEDLELDQQPIWKGKSVYLTSKLELSSIARNSLVRRIQRIGARVTDAANLLRPEPGEGTSNLSESDKLRRELDAEKQLAESDFVISEHRAGWEFWLSLELNKTIGTIHWILGVLNSNNSPELGIKPPSERFLDFPVPSGKVNGWGNTSKTITITNYTGPARSYLIRLLEKMGLKFSGSLDNGTELVIAANKAGGKVAFANKRGIQIVNHIYLEECFQSWTKLSIQAHHLTFPDETNLNELVGQQTYDLENVEKWAKREEVKEQKKLDMKQMPSLKRNALSEMPEKSAPAEQESSEYLAILPEVHQPRNDEADDENRLPDESFEAVNKDNISNPDQGQDEEPLKEVAAADTLGNSSFKIVRRKPRLISSSAELDDGIIEIATKSPQSASKQKVDAEILETGEPSQPNLSSGPDSASANQNNAAVFKLTEMDKNVIPEATHSSDDFPDLLDLIDKKNERSNAVKTSDLVIDKSKTLIDTPLIPGSSHHGSNVVESGNNSATPVRQSRRRAPSIDQNSNQRSPLSSSVHEENPSEFNSEDTNRKKVNNDNINSGARSARRAAQVANRKVTSAVEDMNLHEKEKKRKRGFLAGLEIGGSQLSSKKQTPSSTKKAVVDQILKRSTPKVSSKVKDNSEVKDNDEDSSSLSEQDNQQQEDSGGVEQEDDEDDDEEKSASFSKKAKLKRWEEGKEKETQRSAERPRRGGTSKSKVNNQMSRSRGASVSSTRKASSSSKKEDETDLIGTLKTKKQQKIKISQTGERISEKLCSKLKKLGASFTEPPEDFTHLLTNKITRTEKFILAVIRGCKIVNHSWVEDSIKSGKLLDEEGYELKDEKGESEHDFELKESLETSRSIKLLTGQTFYVSPRVQPSLKSIKTLIESAGGKVITKVPLVRDLRNSKNNEDDDDGGGGKRYSKVVVSCEEDERYWRPLLKKLDEEEPLPIFNQNFILEGLLIQRLDYSKKYQIRY
ncbi:hypothetical protein PPACK8108_LOCUS4612 [Phakopsora pachyrhizi]|uniref:BRCT domain-containing protein n=1 Tax=Phakopsora pachyrhizi TaxID=170000 RepID=A0AAV0AM94_PHAPC|nr:hypothetical protein PPACK8108_LOCUS4612 [Phakopsora pachyrhizi]